MLVTTAFLVVRKERIWQRRESGRLLILSSTTVASSGSVGFKRFEVDSAIRSGFSRGTSLNV